MLLCFAHTASCLVVLLSNFIQEYSTFKTNMALLQYLTYWILYVYGDNTIDTLFMYVVNAIDTSYLHGANANDTLYMDDANSFDT